MNRCSGTVAVLALTGFLLVACLEPYEGVTTAHAPGVPDPENEGLMASLPIYPGATLVQKYVFCEIKYPCLYHLYAASDDGQAVRAFYKQNLADLGWQLDPRSGNDTVLGRFYKDNAEAYVLVWDHEMPPNPDVGQVAPPRQARQLSLLLE